LLKARPETLAKYRNKFNYIMVDEFQDTNIIQYELIKLLTNDAQNIFIVGDQDQSIYSFRGAKVENIDLFIKNFPMCKQILLEENYRSTNPILKIANNVIDCNKHRIKKNLFTNNDSSELPVYYHTSSGYDETMFVIDKIKELHLLGYPYSDFAILYRANALSRQFEDMLLRYQIPYVIYGGLSFFERKEVKDMIAYLRLIINHNDDFAFKRVVNEPKRKIGEALLEKLKTAQVLNNCSLFEAIDHIETAGIGFSNLIAFKFTIIELFDEYINNEEKPFIEIIDAILNKTGYGNMLKNEGDEGQDRLENILEMKTVIEEALEYYELSRKETLDALLSDLALRTDTDNKSENADCVKLMTYHQAKGLEYRVVFMVAMEQGIFPSFNCISELEQDEERRICYVGITRAKEKLYITNAESRYLYGQQQFESPSIYIKEMGLDNLNIIGTIKRPITTPIASVISKAPAKEEKPEAVEINKGDKINHKAFGDGLVVEKSGNIITVAFPAPYGVKKLSAVHPSIRKI
ncbi:MAG: UvrD-helicase domain-containing protein, partial [Acholeplasmatales bacterium]|nr:UvrD-helicase domain-containing protein [Acholeplasmatales bacterium]